MALLALIAGLILLAAGAESLVRGATSLARRMGISTLIVGLTVVAWGTSAPELAASVQATMDGHIPLALGNAIGSNIFNILVILGTCAFLMPMAISVQVIRLDIPIMILFSIVLLVMASDGTIGLAEGVILLLGLVIYTLLQASIARGDLVREAAASPRTHVWADVLFVLVGLVVLVFGARLLVAGAVALARSAGIGSEVIGLTVVALGTSLPEAATSIVAALRGERDIAIGNIIGSNIFNIVGVLGVSALVAPAVFSFDAALHLPDFAVLLAAALVCLPICISGLQISRVEGGLLLAAYVGYITLVIIRALDSSSLLAANAAMLAGAIILPTAAVLVSVLERPVRDVVRRRR